VNEYERIARVIHYLDEHYTDQPDLAALAGHVRLSPFHFHRLFSTWAGITPKDFVECLTLNHAKELLRKGETILGAALGSGLSGPGRLHDLCIKLEAASPGEIKSGGAGCEIRFGFAGTPFGNWLAAENAKGICHVSFFEERASSAAADALHKSWPQAEFTRDDSVAERLAALVFENSKPPHETRPALRAFIRGTDFQVRVWRALLQVPSGHVVSYGRLASLIGNPKASRAVGAAVGQNPLAYLIPCHRVIRETGVVKGYRWGDTRKRALLAWESAKAAG
jgi:AraC family transcriptional regulator, regulatory protein of adaptative response / methylated-DNA-[protein]-cysteine methyltransferase